MSNVNNQPIPTLFVSNLESKVKKDELKRQLYALFVPYGKILDVVAQKGNKMRGQAFVVYEEISAATAAMRALVGEEFYGRPLRITYARTTSNATIQHEDPDAVITKKLRKEDRTTTSRAQGAHEDLERERQEEEEGRGKRDRGENGDADDGTEPADEPEKKKRKVDKADGADADEEEMEMDDE
ncbi:hypothetical protein NliqN6_0775 [Naganishia liquefaciens]|uniref:RRM domain-containing protein n=1 Tax=Naganishia liquefaciens TaxID=104408 RepID=A0A8H3TNN9_9TREE|nr:hypothetical protein NliqN6_0775 [Naganishia liquefaciens]